MWVECKGRFIFGGRDRTRRIQAEFTLSCSWVVLERVKNKVRHPPQSGWLDEWDRLKGGHRLSLGVALKRAFVTTSDGRLFHPRFLGRGCRGGHGFQFKADRRRRGSGTAAWFYPCSSVSIRGHKTNLWRS